MAKFQSLTLPVGTLGYSSIQRPDTKFNEHGNYKADLRVPVADALDPIDQIQAVAKDHLGKKLPVKKNACWEYEVDDDGEETGYVVFKAKASNRMVDGEIWDRKPTIVPRSMQDAQIGSGTTCQLGVEIYTYSKPQAGMNLFFDAIRVIDLVEYGGDKSKKYGWDDEEDASDFETEDASEAPDDDEDDLDDDF